MTASVANGSGICILIILPPLWPLGTQTRLRSSSGRTMWTQKTSLEASTFPSVTQYRHMYSKSVARQQWKTGLPIADKFHERLNTAQLPEWRELWRYLEVMNSMRVLTFPSCSTEMSTSLRIVVCRWEMAALLFPRLILEEVELELSPESVMGEGW